MISHKWGSAKYDKRKYFQFVVIAGISPPHLWDFTGIVVVVVVAAGISPKIDTKTTKTRKSRMNQLTELNTLQYS